MKRKQSEIEFSCGHDDCNRLRRRRHHHNVAVVAFFSSSSLYIFVLFQLDSYVRTHSVPVCKCYMMYEIHIYTDREWLSRSNNQITACSIFIFIHISQIFTRSKQFGDLVNCVFFLVCFALFLLFLLCF